MMDLAKQAIDRRVGLANMPAGLQVKTVSPLGGCSGGENSTSHAPLLGLPGPCSPESTMADPQAGVSSSESELPEDWEPFSPMPMTHMKLVEKRAGRAVAAQEVVSTEDGSEEDNSWWRDAAATRRTTLREIAPGVTTLVIRNIPGRYTKDKLLEEWIPDGTFDLMHLPYNVSNQRSCGYVFLNFVSHAAALEFQAKVHGSYLKFGTSKHLDVSAAEVQGLNGMLELANSNRKRQRVVYEEMMPALFQGKVRVPLEDVLARLGLQHLKLQPGRTQGKSAGKGSGSWLAEEGTGAMNPKHALCRT